MNYVIKELFTKTTTSDWKVFWYVLSNFLDDFKRNPNFNRIEEEPDQIGEHIDAFLAATVEQLAKTNDLAVPKWVYKKRFFLSEPFFPSGLKGDYRFLALQESPLAFSVRNIFVTSNVLDRC